MKEVHCSFFLVLVFTMTFLFSNEFNEISYIFPFETSLENKKIEINDYFILKHYNTDNLVLYLPFNEGNGIITSDKSGNGNDGIILGASWTNGISGYALEFDGNSYVKVPAPDLSTGRITVSVYVYFYEVPNPLFDYSNAIIAQDDDVARVFQLIISSGRFAWHRMGIESDLICNDPIEPQKWYHVAATFNGTFHKLYINGSLNEQHEGTIDFSDTVHINIGRVNWGEFYFSGIIDEVRIYNRALSDGEIASMAETNLSVKNENINDLTIRITLLLFIIGFLGFILHKQRKLKR